LDFKIRETWCMEIALLAKVKLQPKFLLAA
jgi:hypothetical protein